MTSIVRFTGLLALVLVSSIAWSQEKPKDENAKTARERLQQLLKRFPEADTNKDGVLTREEAQAYYQTAQGDGAKKSAAKKQDQSAVDAVKPTQANVKYGPAERNVLDFYQAKSEQPTPLAIYIHGGGFVGGNKNVAPAQIKMFHNAGISLAAIHYRFVDGKEVIFPAPQHDGARAVQFLRSKAKEWNIDPKRVACYGGSAGAGISMWLGLHEDLADPKTGV